MGTRQKTYDHQKVTISDCRKKTSMSFRRPKGDYLNVWNVLWNVFRYFVWLLFNSPQKWFEVYTNWSKNGHQYLAYIFWKVLITRLFGKIFAPSCPINSSWIKFLNWSLKAKYSRFYRHLGFSSVQDLDVNNVTSSLLCSLRTKYQRLTATH